MLNTYNKLIRLSTYNANDGWIVSDTDEGKYWGFILDKNNKPFPTYILPNGKEIDFPAHRFDNYSYLLTFSKYNPKGIYKLYVLVIDKGYLRVLEQ